MSYYLSAFIFQGYGQDDKTKIIEKYSTLDSAKNKLDRILNEKSTQNWELEIFTNEEINELQGNIEFMATAQEPDTINLITWVISPEETPVSNEGALFPEFKDITSEVISTNNIVTADQGFIRVLIATIKMYPVASAGIAFFVYWLLFL
ncbi:MAG: hypothetical protein QM500_09425 [Methylococcales bacterium]